MGKRVILVFMFLGLLSGWGLAQDQDQGPHRMAGAVLKANSAAKTLGSGGRCFFPERLSWMTVSRLQNPRRSN